MPATKFEDKSAAERMQYFIDEADIIGKKIVAVKYTDRLAQMDLGWHKRGPELHLSDGSVVAFLMDDEGNGPGSCEVCRATTIKHLPVF